MIIQFSKIILDANKAARIGSLPNTVLVYNCSSMCAHIRSSEEVITRLLAQGVGVMARKKQNEEWVHDPNKLNTEISVDEVIAKISNLLPITEIVEVDLFA